MTTSKQIEANRRNARKSTGPKTGQGKRRSRCNAIRHGLTAETVITAIEDAGDYKAFETIIVSDYAPETAVERELLLRVASLLWRLRRAASIETGLFQIQAEILQARKNAGRLSPSSFGGVPTSIYRLVRIPARSELRYNGMGDPHCIDQGDEETNQCDDFDAFQKNTPNASRDIAQSFLRLANLHNGVFESIGRYETSLWRQVAQTLFTLERLRHRGDLSFRERSLR